MSKKQQQQTAPGVCSMAPAPPPPPVTAEPVAPAPQQQQVDLQVLDDGRAFLDALAASMRQRQPVAFEALGRTWYALPPNGVRRDARDVYNARQLAARGWLDADSLSPENKAKRAAFIDSLAESFRALALADRLTDAAGKLLYRPGEETRLSSLPGAALVELHDACMEALGEESPRPN